ncbi:[protein-PII] uridylyltransferase [soil metagenome]
MSSLAREHGARSPADEAGSPVVPPGDFARARWERSDSIDTQLKTLYTAAVEAVPTAAGRTSLVAVGGYGRGEMSPRSDVDVVLLHAPEVPVGDVSRLAELLWYPLWDDGVALDHAVRDTRTMRAVASSDWRAALGMLDARHVTGASSLSQDLRSAVLADWRRGARKQLPELLAACGQRAERCGEVAYAAVPDLRDSRGGLRDGVVLRALVATWLVDVPHRQVEEHRAALLDVRDALHQVSGRRSDRLVPDLMPDVAALLHTDPDTLSRHVRGLGRRTAHLFDLTWRRIDQALARPRRLPGRAGRRPRLERLGDGIAVLAGEVVLDQHARVDDDPFLAVRAAAEAAERGLLLGPSTAARLAASAPDPPDPWPDHASRSLVRLLGAGPGLVPVWEELDHAGMVHRWLPEWDGLRLRVSDSPVHRFTVDRHCIETCVEASTRLRGVTRPDVLLVASLLHDIGKQYAGDHSIVGAPTAEGVAIRFGFGPADAAVVGFLVRHHLLLPTTAVRRDIDDPETLSMVADHVGDNSRLALLAALTESDARSASAGAWTTWRAALVRRLVAAVVGVLADRAGSGSAARPEQRPTATPGWAVGVPSGSYRMRVHPQSDGTRVSVAAHDRLGLLADIAGAMAVSGLTIRAARAALHEPAEADPAGSLAVSWWDLDANEVDVAGLRLRLDRVLDGSTDLADRLRSATSASVTRPALVAPPRVQVLADVSSTATVLEIRAADRTGLVWRLCRMLADARVSVRSAHIDTLGPQASDVVYVTDDAGRPLGEEEAALLASGLQQGLAVGSDPARG